MLGHIFGAAGAQVSQQDGEKLGGIFLTGGA